MKTTEEQIEVMKAFLEGEEIECTWSKGNPDAVWDTSDAPAWNWMDCDSRVRPSKRRFILLLHNPAFTFTTPLFNRGKVEVFRTRLEAEERGSRYYSYEPTVLELA